MPIMATEKYSLNARMNGEKADIEIAFDTKNQRAVHDVEVFLGNDSVFEVQFGINSPPINSVRFSLMEAKPGEKLTARFVDSENTEQTIEASIQAQSGKSVHS